MSSRVYSRVRTHRLLIYFWVWCIFFYRSDITMNHLNSEEKTFNKIKSLSVFLWILLFRNYVYRTSGAFVLNDSFRILFNKVFATESHRSTNILQLICKWLIQYMQNNSRKYLPERTWNNANFETNAGVSRQCFISKECVREKWQNCAKNDALFPDNNVYKYLQIFQAVCIVSQS